VTDLMAPLEESLRLAREELLRRYPRRTATVTASGATVDETHEWEEI
jgi:hypothetical protein